jgi:hypothetical protein
MAHARHTHSISTAALVAYSALVVLPLVVLFGRVALDRTPQPVPPMPAPSAAPQLPRTAAPSDTAIDLPPFDAYGAAEAPPFPDLLLAAVDGGPATRLSALHDGPAIVHLWSLACETCADEWPAMRAFASLPVAARNGFPPVLSVLVVQDSAGKPGEAARTTLDTVRREGWFGRPAPDVTVRWAVAEEDVLIAGDVPTPERPITGYPETFILDARGRTRLRLVGPVPWDADTWRRLLGMLPELAPAASAAAAPTLPPSHPPLPPAAAPTLPPSPATP